MSQRTVTQTENSYCDKCEQNVTFGYTEIEFLNDANDVTGTGGQNVFDYGACPVAIKTKNPTGRPYVQEMEECPVWKKIVK